MTNTLLLSVGIFKMQSDQGDRRLTRSISPSKLLILTPFLFLAACGNAGLSCSDVDSKELLKQSLADHYTDVFGNVSYAIEPGTVEANVSAITTITNNERSASCSAHASFTYQNRKALEPKAQKDIDGLVMLIGPRNTDVSYELRKTDDGQLQIRLTNIR